MATTTSSSPLEEATSEPGSLSASAGITGGYTGDSLPMKIVMALMLGLGIYNALEVFVIIFVTFNRYRGLYFWSLIVASLGVMIHNFGFVIKFFQLLDPSQNEGYVAVVILTIGWYSMVTGQSVVLWSRLHLVTNSRRVLNWTLWMIIIDGIVLHATTTILTFGSNANRFSDKVLQRFVHGYGIMEKIQMTGFVIQEIILSSLYIKETVRLLRLSGSAASREGLARVRANEGNLKSIYVRKTMHQLIAISVIIITMDIALLSIELANLYIVEAFSKGFVYSVKLKLEFAVLSKLVQLVRSSSTSGSSSGLQNSCESGDQRATATTSFTLEKSNSDGSVNRTQPRTNSIGTTLEQWPSFVDQRRMTGDVTRANSRVRDEEEISPVTERWEGSMSRDRFGRRSKTRTESWIDEELVNHLYYIRLVYLG
ncbi:hypothetical protein B0J11DRAFT_548264 [Dendryphion nanum]|uniref:DUF7703 domain-containing protein n=1 Tax=Dendryphion nanum TaxID=256645 RepID=A0A9P9E4L9_9PLEO|nr:hypothetical protein B0J11DRAFT_548264 [Dendryphion nanum]